MTKWEHQKEYNKLWYQNNREKLIEKAKRYQEEHKEELKEYHKIYMGKYNKEYHKNNKEKIFKQKIERKEKDSLFKFKEQIRNNIGNSFKRLKHKKNNKTEKILGCSFEEAWKHLKNTWYKNYGINYKNEKFHIDHIIPLVTATNEEEVLKLCNINNLQLLKPEDNMKKGVKYEYLQSFKD